MVMFAGFHPEAWWDSIVDNIDAAIAPLNLDTVRENLDENLDTVKKKLLTNE